jgi:hypothetical protein
MVNLSGCPNFPSLPLAHLVFSQLPLGVLPSEVGLLSELEVLDVEMNSLDGPLPTTIGDLGNLKVRLNTCIWPIGTVTLISFFSKLLFILLCLCQTGSNSFEELLHWDFAC